VLYDNELWAMKILDWYCQSASRLVLVEVDPPRHEELPNPILLLSDHTHWLVSCQLDGNQETV